MMQTEHEGEIGYLSARKLSRTPGGWEVLSPRSKLIVEPYVPAGDADGILTLPEKMQEYERLIVSCVAYGSYSTYVLTGEMGSGKSATLRHLRSALSERLGRVCGKCDGCVPLVMYFDFHRGFGGEAPKRLLQKFQHRLADLVRKETRAVLGRENLTRAFGRAVRESDWEGFDRFVEAIDLDPQWEAGYTEQERASYLFKFIDESGDDSCRLELLMQVLRFLRQTHRPHAACMVTIYDNIDSLAPASQYDVLVEILRLQEFAKVKAVVAMRRSTFARLNNQAAYSFGVISHGGPSAGDVLAARLDHWAVNWERMPQVAMLSEVTRNALKRRLEFVRSHMQGVRERVDWISGESVRNALFLSERLFLNNVIPWDQLPASRDQLVRALLVGTGPDAKLQLDDQLVANVLASDADGRISTIHLRILQLLHAYENDRTRRNVINLIPMLRKIGRWDSDAIRRSINHLMYFKRPLVWADGKTRYKDQATLMDCDDVLSLTEAGEQYLNRHIKDLVYFQECSIATEWPFAFGEGYREWNLPDRFALLRTFLAYLLNTDKSEVTAFVSSFEAPETCDITVDLFSARIVRSIGQSFLRIALANDEWREDHALVSELQDWRSLVMAAHKALVDLGRPVSRLDALLEEYSRALSSAEARRTGHRQAE